jgi:chaperonin GroEL
MASKQQIRGESALHQMKRGVERLSRRRQGHDGAVGRNVVIEKSFGGPAVTKDGVSVAKEVELPEPFENMGAKMVTEVAKKTADKAGDGTTTATVLAEAIFTEGLGHVDGGREPDGTCSAASMTPRTGAAARSTSSPSSARARPTTRRSRPSREPRHGRSASIIAEAVAKVGADGVVEVEEGKTGEMDARVRRGHAVRQGLPEPVLHDRPRRRASASSRTPYILIHEKKISQPGRPAPAAQQGRRRASRC